MSLNKNKNTKITLKCFNCSVIVQPLQEYLLSGVRVLWARPGRPAEQRHREVHAGRDQEGDTAAPQRPVLHPHQQDPTPRHEGCQHPHHQNRNSQTRRLRSGEGVLHLDPRAAQSIYESSGDAVVPRPRTVARGEELHPGHRRVGCGVHHGGDVDAQPHHAGQHGAAPAAADHPAVWLHLARRLARSRQARPLR